VAERFPQLCEVETEMFSRLLGVHVQRLATIAHGDGVCTTHVPANQTHPHDDHPRAPHDDHPRAPHDDHPRAPHDPQHDLEITLLAAAAGSRSAPAQKNMPTVEERPAP
jgi:hypothetical protein